LTPELSIILPVRNQADHIAGLVELYRKEFKGRSWEIILVPNACSDDSPRLCRKMAAKGRGIRVVENPAGGWGLSVRVGLKAAKGRFLCYTNSARTDPATIPPLFEQVKKNPGTLAKVRRHSRGHFLREFGSMIYNFECRLLFGIRCRDVNGTPKVFEAGLLRRLKLASKGDLLDAELLAQCRRLQVPILETPVGGWSRHGGKSSTNFKSAARMYWGAMRLRLGMA
jgi:hypothetical protein